MSTQKVLWEGPIGFEDQETGDGRFIVGGALEWTATEEDPIPLRFVDLDVGAHANAQTVGAITSVERRDGGVIWGSGWLDGDTAEGQAAIHKVANKTQRGISMDLDDVEWEEVLSDEALEEGESPDTRTLSARIRAATIVAIPAFADALINLTFTPEETAAAEELASSEVTPVPSPENQEMHGAVVQAITDKLETEIGGDGAAIVLLPTAEQEIVGASSQPAHVTLAWLGPWAELSEMPELASAIVEATSAWAAEQAALTVPAADRGLLGDESADVVFMERTEALNALRDSLVNLQPVSDRMAQVEQSPEWTPHITLGYPDSPAPEDVPADWFPEEVSFDAVAVWYGDESFAFELGAVSEPEDVEEPVEDIDDEEPIVELQAVTAASAPVNPPIAWFRDPELDGPTPITITKDGRIYGHLAAWDTCHTANPAGLGVCISPPASMSGYSRFHLGTLLTREGDTISVGKITMGTGHAGAKANAQATLAHYDNTGSAVADVRAGEDAWGIWISGAMRPNVSDEKIRILRASPLSGDWRMVDGNLELHAALAVNVPGFPIPATRGLVASGELRALVASGVVVTEQTQKNAEEALADTESNFSTEDIEFLKNLAATAREAENTRRVQKVTSFANKRKVAAFVSRTK